MVPPHYEHGFEVHNYSSIFNCQFYLNELDNDFHEITHKLCFNHQAVEEHPYHNTFQADINKQGIIHLEPGERTLILSIINSIFNEQHKQDNYFHLLKKNYLETLLILLKRVSDQQYKNYTYQPKRNQIMITQVLSFIEENIAEDIDFIKLAKKNNVSPNHFRKLFKDFTGLSPVGYINRLRIIKACDSLLNGNQNMSDIAFSVGIYDANYFSRLFKQYMGCSPRHYNENNT